MLRAGLRKLARLGTVLLTKPHGQKFRSLYADEVGLTFIGNCLGQ